MITRSCTPCGRQWNVGRTCRFQCTCSNWTNFAPVSVHVFKPRAISYESKTCEQSFGHMITKSLCGKYSLQPTISVASNLCAELILHWEISTSSDATGSSINTVAWSNESNSPGTHTDEDVAKTYAIPVRSFHEHDTVQSEYDHAGYQKCMRQLQESVLESA